MARGVNKVILIGNLGGDPETRFFPDGGAVTNANIATSESWRDKQTGEQKEITEWHRVVFRDRGNYRLGQIAGEYLKKGTKVYVEGSLRTRQWEKDGQKHYTTEIIANEMKMLGSRPGGGTPNYDASEEGGMSRAPAKAAAVAGGKPAAKTAGSITDMDDDIPF